MKKIMFNDKYGLTQAVLEGRKTQTRRIVYTQNGFVAYEVRRWYRKKELKTRYVHIRIGAAKSKTSHKIK